MKAGIGIIRKNNFFYTENGSWQNLEAFLVDEPLEYIEKCNVYPCSNKCNICMDACPTHSLSEPYMMCRNTWDGWDFTVEPLRDKMGSWVYGCDACPYNHNKWKNDEDFPE